MWLGEPQFRSETPKKWVVRSKERDNDGYYRYLYLARINGLNTTVSICEEQYATPINTKEEAEEWINPFTEAVEVEE